MSRDVFVRHQLAIHSVDPVASSTGFHQRRGHVFHFLHLRERPARTVVTHVSSRPDFETSKYDPTGHSCICIEFPWNNLLETCEQ